MTCAYSRYSVVGHGPLRWSSVYVKFRWLIYGLRSYRFHGFVVPFRPIRELLPSLSGTWRTIQHDTAVSPGRIPFRLGVVRAGSAALSEISGHEGCPGLTAVSPKALLRNRVHWTHLAFPEK